MIVSAKAQIGSSISEIASDYQHFQTEDGRRVSPAFIELYRKPFEEPTRTLRERAAAFDAKADQIAAIFGDHEVIAALRGLAADLRARAGEGGRPWLRNGLKFATVFPTIRT